jgi:hypothetical protein
MNEPWNPIFHEIKITAAIAEQIPFDNFIFLPVSAVDGESGRPALRTLIKSECFDIHRV